MKSWKRVLSLLLVLLMCLSLLPASALAEGEEELVAAEAEQEVLMPAPEEPGAEEAAPAEPEAAVEAEVPTEEAAPAAEEADPVEEPAPAEAAEKPAPEKAVSALAVESVTLDDRTTEEETEGNSAPPTDYVDLTADNRLLAMDIGVDETKWVRFVPTESREYRFQTESGHTVSLDLYDEAMNPLTFGQSFWSSAEEMGAEPWASGAEILEELESGKTYYLAVSSYQGGSGSTVLTYWEDETFNAFGNPWSVEAEINGPASLGVVLDAEQAYQVSYHWYAPDGTLLAVTETPAYELSAVERSGDYRCVVRDVFGHTSSVTLSVRVMNNIWLTPVGSGQLYLENGQTQTLEVAVGGPGDQTGTTFQWYRLSGEEELIPGETGQSYTIIFDGNQATYCCRMTDAYGNTSSAYFDIRLDNHFRLVPELSGNWTWNEDDHEVIVLLPPNNDGVTLKVRAEGDDLSQFSGYSWGWSSATEENVKSVSENTLELGPVTEKQFCYVLADDGFGGWKDLNFVVSIDNGLGITPVLEDGWTLDEDGTVLITLPKGNAGVTLRADIAAIDPSDMQITWQINLSSDIYETLEGENSSSLATGPIESDTTYDLYVTDRYGNPALQSYRIVVDGELSTPKQFVANTYLMLTVGDTVAPELFQWDDVESAEWFVTDENGEFYASDDDAVISVDEDGNVTALKVGTAYVAADLVRVVGYDYYSGEPRYINETVRCRVDVIPAENEEGEELVNPVDAEVTRLTLRDTKATTELYSTNYTKITVLAETKRLAGAAAIREEDEIEVPKDQGVAIESAWFTGVGAELFELKVVDDRTLAIVPTYDAMELAQAKAANVKKSYTFGIEVVLSDGTSKIVEAVNGKPAALALTVKQTMPTLKASALKFNSLVPWDWHSFGFTGNVVTALEPDYAAAAKAKKEAIPAWLGYGPDGANLMENAPAKASGKLYLLATLEGWAVKKPITVSYSVAATAPTMTLKPATVMLRADQSTSYWTDVTVKPGAFAGPSDFHFEFVIKEKVNKQDVVYENGTVLQVDYSFYSITEKQANGYFDVFLGPDYVDGNHTYTVQARIYNNSGTPFGAAKSFTVKTVAEDRTLKISSRGSIEALAQPGSGGYIYLPASFKCYQLKGNETLSTEIRYVASGSKTEVPVKINVFQNGEFPEDYSGAALFNVYPNQWGVNINLNWHEEPQVKKGTYYAYTTAHFADGTTSKTVKTKLNIKWTDPAKIKLVTVKVNNATGTIDPVRYGSGVTFLLKASNGNFYDRPTAENGAEEPGYVITETIGKSKRELSEAENPFEVYDTYLIVKNTYYPFAVRVSLRDGAVLNPKASYSIKFDFRNYVGIESYSADYKLPIKMAAVKLNALSPVKLLLSDCYSNGEFDILPKDTSVKPVDSITLDAASAKLFELHEVGNGRWAIGFKDNQIPAGLKLGGSKTVKLSITFEGNETGKANTTLSLKVNLK